MKKISDTMRLDWILFEGNIYGCNDADGRAGWRAESNDGVWNCFREHPRQAIDAAIRASRRKKNTEGK